MEEFAHYLPHVNASLNALATVLLVTGYVLIKQKRERAHKITMIASFAVSVIFLACYLVYHANAGSKPFPKSAPSAARIFYFSILLPHVLLAATVPFLAVATIYFGLRDRRATHRRLAKWTFPIWLFVSITGVLVYLMLYQFFPAEVNSTGAPELIPGICLCL